MNNSSLGDCKTETTRKVEKIELNFQDTIYNSKRFKLSFFPWIRTGELKKVLIKEKFHDKNKQLSQKDIRLFCKNIELVKQNKNCFDYYKIDSGGTIIITKNTNQNMQVQNGIINPYQIFQSTPPEINNLLISIQSGLNAGRKPKLASEGTSGTYFLQNNAKKVVAVYKPFDEQPFTPNNPRNFVGQLGTQGIRKGILSGQSATRQVAAYLLDSTHFHQVPATTYVQFYHPSFCYKEVCQKDPILCNKQNNLKAFKTKHGSLQQFVQYFDVVGNLGSHQFDINEVHKIAILDLRILNCDRNQANILVVKKLVADGKSKGTLKISNLIPIDHGLSFPDNFEIYDHQIVWMGYRQAEMPLTQKSLDFIEAIDPVKDCQMLRQKLGFRQICLRNFRVAQIFLKKLVKATFTLKQIGSFMYRNDDDSDSEEQQNQRSQSKKSQLSQLQKLVKQAEIIFYTVKENGIKSTVEFQIGLIKMRKNQQSCQGFEEIKQINSEEQKIKELNFSKNKNKKQVSIQKLKSSSPKTKPRNVSLPNLKKTSSTRDRKLKLKKRQNTKQQKKEKYKNENWGEVFFHYFEDLLDRFIIEKLKTRKKPAPRGRLMSENIQSV